MAEETEAVKQVGVFGSPSFIVEGEVFWGDDRLDDAVQWSRNGSLEGVSIQLPSRGRNWAAAAKLEWGRKETVGCRQLRTG